MLYGLYQLIHTSRQLAFFKAVFLFLLTTNANPASGALAALLLEAKQAAQSLTPSHNYSSSEQGQLPGSCPCFLLGYFFFAT